MADNVPITPGVGRDIAADDISSVWHQRVKLSLGADGSAVDAIAGAGVVGTGVQRVTLASDDPAVTALQIMDDWDETNRCAVNLISGQVGIAGGAGAVGATVPRATLASDDPAVASLAIMDDWDESDRAKANIIVGQAGVAAGAGASGATVQRVVEAARAYETVAASQTAQALGATGATGDTISRIVIIPATTSPGAVDLLDNATSINIFPGGALSVSELKPIVVQLGMISVSGAWKITTGANVSAIGIGSFT